jgi:hypothetical protein
MNYICEWDPANEANIQNTDANGMKPNYNFSKGERGKFYHPDADYHIPIYLDADVEEAMQALAKRTGQKRPCKRLLNAQGRRGHASAC